MSSARGEVGEQRLPDVAQGGDLLRAQLVEQVAAHSLDGVCFTAGRRRSTLDRD